MENGNDRMQSALVWLASGDLPRGVPIPRTGKRRHHKYTNGSGVCANSRVVSHRYADEGDKGKTLRREIRRKERAQWLSEAVAEQEAELMELMSYDSWE